MHPGQLNQQSEPQQESLASDMIIAGQESTRWRSRSVASSSQPSYSGRPTPQAHALVTCTSSTSPPVLHLLPSRTQDATQQQPLRPNRRVPPLLQGPALCLVPPRLFRTSPILCHLRPHRPASWSRPPGRHPPPVVGRRSQTAPETHRGRRVQRGGGEDLFSAAGGRPRVCLLPARSGVAPLPPRQATMLWRGGSGGCGGRVVHQILFFWGGGG